MNLLVGMVLGGIEVRYFHELDERLCLLLALLLDILLHAMHVSQPQVVTSPHYKITPPHTQHTHPAYSIPQLLQYFMNHPQSTYSKLSNASAKLSTRRIFTKSNLPNQAGGNGSGNDLFRIAAKIRELEDDVKSVLDENAEIEGKNKELIRVLEELEYVVDVQQLRVDELTKCLRKDIEAGESLADYEQDLKTVAEQINTLNYMITQKNDQYQVLKAEKEDLQYDSIKLKEQANHLQYDFNVAHADLDGLIEEEEQPTDLYQKAQLIFKRCEEISSQVGKYKQEIEEGSKANAEKLFQEKEKRFKLEYEVKLLRERKSDQLKKENYFRGFYDQERIQEVIDDMLRKQDSLRKQIAEQEETNLRLQQDFDQQIAEIEKQHQREQLKSDEQIRLLSMELQILTRQLQQLTQQHSEAILKLQRAQADGIEMQSFQQQLDGQVWQRIRTTEQQNLHLQQHFQQLSTQVALLNRSLSL